MLPRVIEAEVTPLDTPDLTKLMHALKRNEYEALLTAALFTGMRSGELLGLTWDCVDFEKGMIHVVKQLIPSRKRGDKFHFGPLKNNKTRSVAPAQFVMDILKKHRAAQRLQKVKLGPPWDDGGFPDLVFTYPNGHHLTQWHVCRKLQEILQANGIEKHRFHDLRHTYVVNAFRAGDDVKTVQQNAGHYSAAFTLDRYGHVTNTMQKESADRMQRFIEGLG